MPAAVCLPSSSSTSVMTTCAPSDANNRASAAPCPRAPPVISATLPSSFPMKRTLDELDERSGAFGVLVRDLEQDAIEDEELRDPEHAEPDHIAEVGQERVVGILVLEDDDGDRRQQQPEEGHDPEGNDLGVEAALAPLLPDPVTAHVVGRDGADGDRGDVGPAPRPVEHVREQEDEALAQHHTDDRRHRVLPELLDQRALVELLEARRKAAGAGSRGLWHSGEI